MQRHYLLGPLGISFSRGYIIRRPLLADRRTEKLAFHLSIAGSFVDDRSSMSDKCGNCDCADKSQCVKKGDSYGVVIVDAEKSHIEVAQEVACENDGKCKCGTSCSCTDCNCGK